MLRRSVPLVLLISAVVWAADEPLPAPQPAGRDCYGDPLPTGARFRLGTIRFRHGNSITYVGFSKDGKRLVSAGLDGFARVWETATGKELHRITLPTGGGNSGSSSTSDGTFVLSHRYEMHGVAPVALAPDGETLAVFSSNGDVTLWNTATGKEVRKFRIKGNGSANLIFSPDGKKLALKGQDGIVRIYEVATGKELHQLGKDGNARRFHFGFTGHSIAFTPDGKEIASYGMIREQPGGLAYITTFWDAESGKEIRKIKVGANLFAASIGFTPDGKTLGLVGTDGAVRLLDVMSGKEIRQFGQGQQQFNRSPSLPLFSPDGKTVAVSAGGIAEVVVWEVATGKEVRKLGPGNRCQSPAQALDNYSGREPPRDIALSPDGKTLALGTGLGAIHLFDTATGKDITPVDGHRGAVETVSVSADGKRVTTVAADETLRQWEAPSGKEARQLRLTGGAGYPVLAPDGRTVAFGTPGNKVHLWDVAAGKETHSFGVPGVNFVPLAAGATGMAFTSDGKSLLMKDLQATLHRWDVATGRELIQFTTRSPGSRPSVAFVNGFCPGIAVSPDDNTVAVAGGDSGSDLGGVRLWNLATGRQVRMFSVKGDLRAIGFTPDGRKLASVHERQLASLREALTGKECCQFKDGKSMTCSAFSPDGRILAAGSENGSIHFWDAYTTKKLGEFTGHQGAIHCLRFSVDSTTLFSGSADTTLLAWDVADRIKPEMLATVELDDNQLTAHWSDLGGDDAGKAFQAFGGLIRGPKPTVAFLKKRMKPAAGVSADQLNKLLRQLESNRFSERQKATDELERLGELVEPTLKKLLQGKPTLETQQRLERLLERLVTGQPPPLEVLQALRAVEVLEALGTPEARALLETISKGAPGAKLTEAARESLARLTRK